MSVKNWENYIHNKFNFYIQQGGLTRVDSEFPWTIVAPPMTSQRDWEVVQTEVEHLYEARCLLNDELSQLLYDEAVILRLVSHNRFFYPRISFDQLADLLERELFSESGYPDNYLGLPLEKNRLILEPGSHNTMLYVITPAGFIDFLNMWRQYLISRGSFEFRPRVGGVVFDCGACIGDISVIFAGLVGPKGQVHAFDPIPLHIKFCALQSKLNPTLSKALIFNQMAVGKEVQKVNTGARSDSDAIAPGGLPIDNFNMTSLDGYVSSHNLDQVDFIKMDIEGAERQALLGAENVIREFKPKLAISTYHHPDDFWSLPLQIKKINPSYKFAFGHHSPVSWESVIYAYEP